MKVKELIDYLKACNSDYEVKLNSFDITEMIKHVNYTQPEASYVDLKN